jgi:hypothetical protein
MPGKKKNFKQIIRSQFAVIHPAYLLTMAHPKNFYHFPTLYVVAQLAHWQISTLAN